MTRTVDEAIAWARAHPTKDVGSRDDSWSGWCAALVYWAGGFSSSFSYALWAGDASGPLNPDWTRAPRGAIHYWGGVWINGVENGHVAIDIGSDHTLLMASSRVSNFGNAIGTLRFAAYGLPNYRGWSMNWGSESLATSSVSALAVNGISNVIPGTGDDEEEAMLWNFVGGGGDISGVYVVGPRGHKHLTSQEFDLMKRFRIIEVDINGKLTAPDGGVQMNSAEIAIVSGILAQIV